MPPVTGDSNTNDVPAVEGFNSAAGVGVSGDSGDGIGVRGHTTSTSQAGVAGFNENPTSTGAGVFGSAGGTGAGVFGESNSGEGVHGESNSDVFAGVAGQNRAGFGTGAGVFGEAITGAGVFGRSQDASGIFGTSRNSEGVRGETNSTRAVAVAGLSLNANGTGVGVFGSGEGGGGVLGVTKSANAPGVAGSSTGRGAGVFGENLRDGAGVHGKGRTAGFFEGNVFVRGDISSTGSDCAEDFDVAGAEEIEPGTVVVLDTSGGVLPSHKAYDTKVAGVISGAGGLTAGLTLGKSPSGKGRRPVALMGKVYCRADASYGAISVGDLLTTSPNPGYAMKATDRVKALGAIIGKALIPLPAGRGLVPILITLQ